MPTIHEFLSPGADGLEPRLARFEPGDRVLVTGGPWKGKLGTVTRDHSGTVYARLDYSIDRVEEFARWELELRDVVTCLGDVLR